MNRLKICEKYMNLDTKMKDEKKYYRAQKLHYLIIKKQDEIWKQTQIKSFGFYLPHT